MKGFWEVLDSQNPQTLKHFERGSELKASGFRDYRV